MTHASETAEPILLVVNPISGDIDKSELIRRVEQTVGSRQPLKIYTTTGSDDQAQIADLLNTFPARRVLVAGGDGTIKMMAEVLRDQKTPLGILPTGSANGLARSLDLPVNLEEALDVATGNHFQDMDALCINNELCLHISDLGLNAELIRNYESGNVRGKIGYILQSIPTLVGSDMPFTFEVIVGDRTFHRQGILLAIANAQKYGTGATINPDSRIDDGKFEILVFKKLNVVDIAKTLQEEVQLGDDFMESISVTQAEIRCQQPVPFQIDGEYYGEVKQVDAKILPRHLKIAVAG